MISAKGGRAMKRLPIVTVAAVLMGFLSAACVDAIADIGKQGWSPLNKDVSIKKKSIVYPSKTTVSLWIKVVPAKDTGPLSDAGTLLMDKGRDDQALAYDHTGYLTEIDCLKNKHRELIAILYDANSNIIHSVQHEHASWEAIPSGSSYEAVQEAVCAYD